MNTIQNKPIGPSGEAEVDRLLTSFYRSEMPAQWPASPQPWNAAVTPAAATPKTNQHSRSRWALAASVALIVGGCWYLSGHMTDGKRGPNRDFDNGAADTKHIKDLGKGNTKTK